MTTLAATQTQQMAEALRKKLAELSPDVILAINNASYHAFRLVASEPSSGLRPYLARLRHLNAASYLADTPSVALFVSELEYGRSLKEAALALPSRLRRTTTSVALIENSSSDIRRARREALEMEPSGELEESGGSVRELLSNRLHVCLAFDSDGFHETLGALRQSVIARLNRPFNIDATLALVERPADAVMSELEDRLTMFGPVARLLECPLI